MNTTQMTTNIHGELAYLLLRTALDRYQKTTIDLNNKELEAVQTLAERQYELQNLILSSAEAINVIVPETQIDSALSDIRSRYEDEDSFESDLARNHMNIQSFIHAVRRELHVETVMNRVAARAATVNQLDADIFYYMHPERFQIEEKRTARHILITINAEYPENKRENALQRLQLIRKRLDKNPERFTEQAQKHSECPTAMQGGLLGEIARGKLYPELEIALFALKKQEISEIIESELGFHLLFCEAINPAGLLSLESARPKILQYLQERRQRICQKAWLAELAAAKEATLTS